MKLASMLISALAAVASAAPAATGSLEKRGRMDLGEFNNFDFANEKLQYFDAINKLDLEAFAKLSAFKKLDISDFKRVFVRDELDINALLQLQVVAVVSQLADVGLFDDFDVAVIKIKTLDLGLLSDIGRFDIDSLIDDSRVPLLKDAIRENGRKNGRKDNDKSDERFKDIFSDDKSDERFKDVFSDDKSDER
ncbi:hypothetical protein DL764_007118 [Monosporascus ibericus]|uniref:Uncharacterized protein n=1 Tax=Monosporascus ibericus TaxID=155417 RepID=A0A4Q4T307_9PEZI|nr:hypothetical protein DL764_007118 [Monosporascus ibericus]